MGLMLSVLVFTVGVIEALSCIRHVRRGFLPLEARSPPPPRPLSPPAPPPPSLKRDTAEEASGGPQESLGPSSFAPTLQSEVLECGAEDRGGSDSADEEANAVPEVPGEGYYKTGTEEAREEADGSGANSEADRSPPPGPDLRPDSPAAPEERPLERNETIDSVTDDVSHDDDSQGTSSVRVMTTRDDEMDTISLSQIRRQQSRTDSTASDTVAKMLSQDSTASDDMDVRIGSTVLTNLDSPSTVQPLKIRGTTFDTGPKLEDIPESKLQDSERILELIETSEDAEGRHPDVLDGKLSAVGPCTLPDVVKGALDLPCTTETQENVVADTISTKNLVPNSQKISEHHSIKNDLKDSVIPTVADTSKSENIPTDMKRIIPTKNEDEAVKTSQSNATVTVEDKPEFPSVENEKKDNVKDTNNIEKEKETEIDLKQTTLELHDPKEEKLDDRITEIEKEFKESEVEGNPEVLEVKEDSKAEVEKCIDFNIMEIKGNNIEKEEEDTETSLVESKEEPEVEQGKNIDNNAVKEEAETEGGKDGGIGLELEEKAESVEIIADIAILQSKKDVDIVKEETPEIVVLEKAKEEVELRVDSDQRINERQAKETSEETVGNHEKMRIVKVEEEAEVAAETDAHIGLVQEEHEVIPEKDVVKHGNVEQETIDDVPAEANIVQLNYEIESKKDSEVDERVSEQVESLEKKDTDVINKKGSDLIEKAVEKNEAFKTETEAGEGKSPRTLREYSLEKQKELELISVKEMQKENDSADIKIPKLPTAGKNKEKEETVKGRKSSEDKTSNEKEPESKEAKTAIDVSGKVEDTKTAVIQPDESKKQNEEEKHKESSVVDETIKKGRDEAVEGAEVRASTEQSPSMEFKGIEKENIEEETPVETFPSINVEGKISKCRRRRRGKKKEHQVETQDKDQKEIVPKDQTPSQNDKQELVRVKEIEESVASSSNEKEDTKLPKDVNAGKGKEEEKDKSKEKPKTIDQLQHQVVFMSSSIDDEDVETVQLEPVDRSPEKAFWLIFSGEYTKAMSKDWHSGHFCCWQCDESLTGQRYVLRDDHPYCIKCYESVFANSCEECNRIIGIDSKDLSYKDKHWHEACFLCSKCRVSLVDKQFGSKADKIYCGNCYDAQFASRCDGCGQIFRAGTKKMEYKTRQWHEQCFCCCVCKTPIGTKSFIPREQEIYCATCYEEKFATRCIKCNKIITSGGVTYKNEPWHRECFTCTNCNTSLAGQRFTSRDEKPYCADCFGELFAKRCTACCKPITGIGGTRFISFEDRHWHNDCFICASCKTSLVGRGFITDAEDIICPECAKQKLI